MLTRCCTRDRGETLGQLLYPSQPKVVERVIDYKPGEVKH